VRLAGGREETYDFLVSTLPIPLLYRMLLHTPDELQQAARGLKAISILNINIGIDRPDISNQHWIYFPEDRFVFSRVGFPSNFSKSAAPEGTSSIYIEITHSPAEEPDIEAAFERSLADLKKCGILRPDDRVLTRHVLDIKCAYVVFDRHRQKYLGPLIDYLESVNIHTAGRYGRWDYHSMEDSILSGKAAAEAIARAAAPSAIGT
jgi:UDP-galactopyranose mutase